MALDPRAPLLPSANEPYDILGTIAKADAFNDLQQKRKDAEAERERQARINATIQQYPDDPDEAIRVLRQTDWQAAATLQKQVTEQKKAVEDARKVEIENEAKEWEVFSQLLGDGSETSFKRLGEYAAQRDSGAAQFFQQPYSPELVQQLRQFGLTAQQRLEAEKKATESLDPSKWAGWFAAATDEDDWQETAKAARFLLGKQADQVLGVLPSSFSPEAVERAKQLALGPAKVEELAGQAEGRDIQRAGQAVTMRGQDIGAQTAAANRAVTIRGQNLTDARAKAAAAAGGAGGEGGVKLGVGAVEKIAGVDQSLAMLDDIEKLLPQMRGNIGVIDGRVAKARLSTGVGVDEDLATFAAQITGLKNATIKALTGAQMSEPEAKRIMGQVPDMTNPEPVFRARMATTRKNLTMLKQRTIELSGGYVAPSGDGGGPVRVQGKDGKTYEFPTRQAAEAAKRDGL